MEPALSVALNPIENLWDQLSRHVEARNSLPQKHDEPRTTLHEEREAPQPTISDQQKLLLLSPLVSVYRKHNLVHRKESRGKY
ncbi:hypothetical protein GDO81_028569 [Engystomops pustulosus]|uniref:Uncharacterized protein n=1 Tax=Engystomops pustulosus TaxID=76066 RepID=A0AAV6ZIJ2_ENGPU|nr:hypothetical protein GDO81_028569 [Engystomops pustulosus]